MSTLSELRARAEAHQAHLDRNTKFFTVKDLAARWGCSANTVRAIGRDVLPYLHVGTGLVRESRRYDPADVLAYELAQRDGRAA
jgi:hypothetical protein